MGWSARPLSSENGSPGGSGGTCGWGGGPSPSPLVFKKFRIGVLPSRTVDGNDPQLQIRFPPCLSLPWRFLFLFSQDRRRSYAPQPTLPQGSAHHPPNDCTPKPNPNSPLPISPFCRPISPFSDSQLVERGAPDSMSMSHSLGVAFPFQRIPALCDFPRLKAAKSEKDQKKLYFI